LLKILQGQNELQVCHVPHKAGMHNCTAFEKATLVTSSILKY